MLYLAKDFVENNLTDILTKIHLALKADDKIQLEELYKIHLKERNLEFETFLNTFLIDLFDKYKIKPIIVYGDTDSVFINFDMKDIITDEDIYLKDTLIYNIELGKITSKFLKTLLQYPQNMEYEKTFYPFALMAKKKYIGNKYEEDPTTFKQTSMGVVLKRRDNANIVKKIIGGMVNIMMNEIDIEKAIRFIKKSVNDLLCGRYDIHDFITSKTLKAEYVDRTRLAHVVLADRMAERDPGNAPQLNDRIPFVAIEVKERKGIKLLQGNRIEHPDYILENKLKIDYLFYLTNQIINPATQFLELIMKPKEVDNIFREFIINEENRRKGIQSLTKFGITKSNSDGLNIIDEFDFDSQFINTKAKPNNNIKSKKKEIINISTIIDSDDLSLND
jgi:DNA polymerase elongation subunit (family B)